MKKSFLPFRHWLQHKWHEHRDELESFGSVCDYDHKEYFAKYKYWLKREYQFQRNKEQLDG